MQDHRYLSNKGNENSLVINLVQFISSALFFQASSIAAAGWKVDFDLVLKNIQELNVLAGEGCAVVSHTKGGATLKVNKLCSLGVKVSIKFSSIG